MTATHQCSTCEMIWDLVNTGERRLEEISKVLGKPTPSIVRHLKDHGDASDNLRHIVTYAGQPLLRQETPRPSASPDVDAAAPGAPTPGATAGAGVPAEDQPAPAILTDWPEGTDPQELVDAGLITPDELDVPVANLDADPGLDLLPLLYGISQNHPHEPVRRHARGLFDAIEEWGVLREDRMLLEQLTVQRDQLQAQISRLEARLGLQPATSPTQTLPPAVWSCHGSRSGEWGRANGYPVKPTGKVARSVVEAWQSATGQVAS